MQQKDRLSASHVGALLGNMSRTMIISHMHFLHDRMYSYEQFVMSRESNYYSSEIEYTDPKFLTINKIISYELSNQDAE